jgi:uncharacterized hydrophobic protein (TIGR00271 family)
LVSRPTATIPRVLHLRLSASEGRSDAIGRALEDLGGVSRVLGAPSPGEAIVVISADVEPSSADDLLAVLHELEVHSSDYVLTKMEVVAPIALHQAEVSASQGFAWLEVLGEARVHARPLARFLVLMAVAGVIAALGVIESNAILIVGAMAVSPDLLPVCAFSVGLVGRRWGLVRISTGTLSIGLSLVAGVAALVTFLLVLTGLVDSGFNVGDSSISPLAANTDYSTVLVALAAGVAAMLSFETKASAAVGVAISVTTIPASAYLGVALGNGQHDEVLGALLVLGINVTLLIVAATLTLLFQRRLALRKPAGPPRTGARPPT